MVVTMLQRPASTVVLLVHVLALSVREARCAGEQCRLDRGCINYRGQSQTYSPTQPITECVSGVSECPGEQLAIQYSYQHIDEGDFGVRLSWKANTSVTMYHVMVNNCGSKFCRSHTVPSSAALNGTVSTFTTRKQFNRRSILCIRVVADHETGISRCIAGSTSVPTPVSCYDAFRNCSLCGSTANELDGALEVFSNVTTTAENGMQSHVVRWRYAEGSYVTNYSGVRYHLRVQGGSEERWLQVEGKLNATLHNLKPSTEYTVAVWRYECGCSSEPMGELVISPIAVHHNGSSLALTSTPLPTDRTCTPTPSPIPFSLPMMPPSTSSSTLSPSPASSSSFPPSLISPSTSTHPPPPPSTSANVALPISVSVVAVLLVLALAATTLYFLYMACPCVSKHNDHMKQDNAQHPIKPAVCSEYSPAVDDSPSSTSDCDGGTVASLLQHGHTPPLQTWGPATPSSALILYSLETPEKEVKMLMDLLVGGLAQYDVQAVAPGLASPRDVNKDWVESWVKEADAVLLFCNQQFYEEWTASSQREGEYHVGHWVRQLKDNVKDLSKFAYVYMEETDRQYSELSLYIGSQFCITNNLDMRSIAQFVKNMPSHKR